MVALLDEFCPDCGTHRVALFRYCLACGLDYDELDARGELPLGPYARSTVDPGASPSATRAAGTARQAGRADSRRWRRYIPIGAAAVLGIAVVGLLALGAGNGVTTAVTGSGSSAPSAAAEAGAIVPAAVLPSASPTATPIFAPTGPTTKATVTRVVDGDTIIVSVEGTEYRVRYLGIDAPASVSVDQPVEFMGREAADANRRLVSSANVVLEREQTDTDAHGQLLRDVWVEQDGVMTLVGLQLVGQGLARVDAVAPDLKYQARLAAAQQTAQTGALGIWSAPPLPVTGATPAPAGTALPRLVGIDPVTVYGSAPTTLRGAAGIYSWRSVGFGDPQVVVHWELGSTVTRGCALDWRLEPASGDPLSGTITVKPSEQRSGQRTERIGFTEAVLTITSTCSDWSFSLQGATGP